MKNLVREIGNKNFIIGCISLGIISVILGLFINSYSLMEEISSVSFSSKALNYQEASPGSFSVTKSAEWESINKAKITFEVDSVRMDDTKNRDVILVLDTSDSMLGDKIDQLRNETISLIKNLLADTSNRVALITYGTDARVISDFVNESSILEVQLNTYLEVLMGQRNHYDALVKVEGLLKHYQKNDNRDCVVLFVTDGYADKGTPNEVIQYNYLKEEYPYVMFQAVQYGMGDEPLPFLKQISDYQYAADLDNIGDVLEKAISSSLRYDEFNLTDWIQSDYFTVSAIQASLGEGKLIEEGGKQKVTWRMNTFQTGTKETLTIHLSLNAAYQKDVGFFSTNEKEEVHYKLGNVKETISSNSTPVLATHYEVSYDANEPSGCSISSVPETKQYHVKDMVKMDDSNLSCEGYQFVGWKIITPGVETYSEEYFEMPGKNVSLKGEWSKFSIVKAMDGLINPKRISIIQNVGGVSYGERLWKYKSSVSKIVFEDVFTSHNSEIEIFDISEKRDGSVVARIVSNGDGTHTAYIQGDGVIYTGNSSAFLFSGFTKLEKIENLDILDTSNSTNMSFMFSDCPNLVSVDVSHFNTAKVSDMQSMFSNCNHLTNLNLSSFDTSQVIFMTQMFSNCSSLTSLDLSGFHTPKLVVMSQMFYNCSSLSSLNLTGFDTSSVRGMNSTFFHCSSLASLNVSSFNTSNTIDMAYMFAQCFSLTSLDLSNFDTSKVESMEGMFYGGYNSELMMLSILNLSSFDTSNVTSMAFMFGSCGNLAELNVNHFDTSKVTDMQLMFYNCRKLGNLDLSNFKTQNVTDMNMMFNGCTSLISLDIHNFNTSNVTLMQFMFIYCGELTELNVSNFDTSKVTNMNRMFYDCGKIRVLDVSGWNTEKVTDMGAMFRGCNSLETLNVSNFRTPNVTDMSYMFWHCENLTILDVSHFDTSKVTTLSGMFNSCYKVVTLDVSNWNTENVTLMDFLFTYCKALTSLDVSKWSTDKVLNMEYMFTFESENLTTLDVSHFNTSNVLYMNNMFQGAHGLTTLDLSNFDTSKVQRMDYMFESCINLSSINLNFQTPSLISAIYLFSNCQRLVSIDLSKMDTSKIIDMTNMFANCWSLSILDFRSAVFDQVTVKDDLITNYQAITKVIVKDTNAKTFFQNLLGDKSSVVVTVSEI